MNFKSPREAENYMIEEVLSNFDFNKCKMVMDSLNWTWGFHNQTPQIEQIKKAAVDRMKSVIELTKSGSCHKSSYFTSSGGLKATAWKNKYGHIEGLQLEFVLTDWQSDGDY